MNDEPFPPWEKKTKENKRIRTKIKGVSFGASFMGPNSRMSQSTVPNPSFGWPDPEHLTNKLLFAHVLRENMEELCGTLSPNL